MSSLPTFSLFSGAKKAGGKPTSLPGVPGIVLRGHRHGRVEDNNQAVLVSVKGHPCRLTAVSANRSPPTLCFCASSFKRYFSATTLNPHTFITNKLW